MEHVHAHAVVHELVVELPRALLALEEDQHGRAQALADQLPDRKELALLPARADGGGGRRGCKGF